MKLHKVSLLKPLYTIDALYQCCCPRGPIYRFLSLSSNKSVSLDHKVLENCRGLRIPQTVSYVCHVKSINLSQNDNKLVCKIWLQPPCMRLWWRMSYLLISDITYWYISVSNVFVLKESPCPRHPRGPIYKSLSSDHKSLSLSSNVKSWQHHSTVVSSF